MCPKSDGDCTGGRITAEAVYRRDIYFWKLNNTGFGVFQPFGINPVGAECAERIKHEKQVQNIIKPVFLIGTFKIQTNGSDL